MTTEEGEVKPKERPILFSAPMVRALLAGRKTQTRRVVKWPEWISSNRETAAARLSASAAIGLFYDGRPTKRFSCPYGAPGDRLWVKETTIIAPPNFSDDDRQHQHVIDREGRPRLIQYLATSPDREGADGYGLKARPSIHMPRWASRITLEVTGVRVERVQDISEEDAKAEGIRELPLQEGQPGAWFGDPAGKHDRTARLAFQRLWCSINGAESWSANPWVWVVGFRRVTP